MYHISRLGNHVQVLRRLRIDHRRVAKWLWARDWNGVGIPRLSHLNGRGTESGFHGLDTKQATTLPSTTLDVALQLAQ